MAPGADATAGSINLQGFRPFHFFSDFLDTLLVWDNFNFYKEVEGQPLIAPRWSFCLSYELEIRKEAIRLCEEESYVIQSALWSTLTEHRTKHWSQLVAIPNSGSSSNNSEMQAMKKRIADLEKARSRSPRRKQISQPSFPSMLVLPASSAPAEGQKGGKGKNNKKKSKGKGKGGSSCFDTRCYERFYLLDEVA